MTRHVHASLAPSKRSPKVWRVLAALIASLGLLTSGHDASSQEQSVADFYRGKRITLIVGYEPGSAYDVSARVLSRHIGRYLPGQPAIIVQNIPAAGSIVAGNTLFNVSERDGTVIGMLGRVLPYQAMLGQAGIKFVPDKFNWIGSPTRARRICVANRNARVQKPADLFTQELIVGGTGAGSAATSAPTLLNRLLGMKFRVVDGYKGAANILLAMSRGEAEGICTGIETLETSLSDWQKSDKVRALFNMEPKADPEFVGIPTVFDYAKTDEQKLILRLFSTSVELGQPIAAPPQVPTDRVVALRQAFEATTRDATYVAELAKVGFRSQVVHADELTSLVNGLMQAPADVIEQLKKVAGP